MRKKHLIQLIPFSEDIDNDLLSLAIKYQKNEGLSLFELPNSVFSPDEMFGIVAEERMKKYFEVATGREIFTDEKSSVKVGYTTARIYLYKIKGDNKDDLITDADIINSFLDECEMRRMRMVNKIQNYIYNVMENDAKILEYLEKLKSNDDKFFMGKVNIYSHQNQKYEEFIIPFRRSYNDKVDKKYIDATFGCEIPSISDGEERAYVSDEIELNMDSFELLSNCYELIFFPERVRARLDASVNKKNMENNGYIKERKR